MNTDQLIDMLWSSIQLGVHDPAELSGVISSIDDAYRVQLGLLGCYERAGDRQVGWKVGLTAKAIQAQLNFHEPVFGFLLQTGLRPSGTVFEFASLIRPGFENELCLTLGAPLIGPGVTFEQARAAISHVAPALEIIEKRQGARPEMGLALADNGQQKAFVTGAEVQLGVLDLAEVMAEVIVNGVAQERARGAEVLGTGPVESVAWLANKLAQFDRHLQAGTRIMSGSFTKQYDISPGDAVEARFERIGAVSATFR